VKLRWTEILSVAGLAYGSLTRHKPWQCRLPCDESASFPGCWQDEEVDCRDAFGMIVQKGPPVLGRRAAVHVPRHRPPPEAGIPRGAISAPIEAVDS
jgi:hypothetical protein